MAARSCAAGRPNGAAPFAGALAPGTPGGLGGGATPRPGHATMPDPVLETVPAPVPAPNAPNAPADAPPAAPAAPAGPPPLGLVVFALRAGATYLDRFVHDAPFRAALGELEAPALASVQAAIQGQIGPEVVLAALEVCDFYADFGGPLEDAFQDLLDEHAAEVLANVRYAAGTAPAPL